MISSVIPDDILALIITGTQTAEMDEILPPKAVRDAVLIEKGITAAPPDWSDQSARDWLEAQIETQDRAYYALGKLLEKEQLTETQLLAGKVPSWATRKWADQLNFMWSDGLSKAVGEAMEYLFTE
jgi:hypothetical protein